MYKKLAFLVAFLLLNAIFVLYASTYCSQLCLGALLATGNAGIFLFYIFIEHKACRQPKKIKSQPKATQVKELLEQERFKNREQLSEIDLLREQENYRREYVGNVSHELKTPLFSIQGFVLTLIEGGLEDPKIRDKYLERISKSVERLIYLTKDLELLSEIENDNLNLNIRAFNLRALVQEVFDLLELKAMHNNIQLKFKQDISETIRVVGDIEKIERVIINLVANAINHANRPATLTVDFKSDEERVITTIADNGIGIKELDKRRIFERFYRVDKSRSRGLGGSGIGLSIVKHILEAHGHKIEVESQYGEGTTFRFALHKA